MRTLILKLVFPYNWYHYRKVKIYDDAGKLLTKIMHSEEQEISLSEDVRKLNVRLDFFKSEIQVPQENSSSNLILYLNFRNKFPFKYFDVLKRNCLTGNFVNDKTFKDFDASFYQQSEKWRSEADIDKPNLVLGFIISAALILVSLVEQENPFRDLVFFIGLASLVSLLMIFFENKKLTSADYRTRMLATGLAFLLGSGFLDSAFLEKVLFVIFSVVFLLKGLRIELHSEKVG